MTTPNVILGSGSRWLRWEPHIHAPGTVFNDLFRGGEPWEDYLTALESASPTIRAIGVTDYYSTRTYQRVVEAKAAGRLPQCDLIFPNIEMRLGIGTVKGHYVNVHLLVSPEDPDHVEELNRFLHRLTFRTFEENYSCTPADLTKLGRKDKPELTDDRAALEHGSQQFKVNQSQLEKEYGESGWAKENIRIAVSGNDDGTAGVRDGADVLMRQTIEKLAHVMFASNPKQRDYWLGFKESHPADVIRARYGNLKPCLHGSDAHSLATVAAPDLSRFSWIKGTATFDALRQACIEPNRAYVGEDPPRGATPSQAITSVKITDASWALTPAIELNPGLIAIIGARGSGKTALADMIAAGCDALPDIANTQSFLNRAHELLDDEAVSITWGDGQLPTTRSLANPKSFFSDTYPRARYLTQQFVDELCSSVGMTDALIAEIERVIFDAHSTIEQEGAMNFQDLRALRASTFRETREREEEALATVSDRIGSELEKAKLVAGLKTQIAERQLLIGRYVADRSKLIGKGSEVRAARLALLMASADKVRSYLRHFANQRTIVLSVKEEVADLRANRAPEALRRLKERYQASGIDEHQWDSFLLTHVGDVDSVVTLRRDAVEKSLASWKGVVPTQAVTPDGAFVDDHAELERQPLAVLEAEIERLQKLVTVDRQTTEQYAAISKRIVEETAQVEKLKERLTDCEGASARALALVAEREAGYFRVFEAVLSEQKVLTDLYTPLSARLQQAHGSLKKMSFSVRRAANVDQWARTGESLFDLRRQSPFQGRGAILKAATSFLKDAWEIGDAATVATAMKAFRDKHQGELLEQSPISKADQANYRSWTKRFAQWLYSTDHIQIEYSVEYDGIAIQKLSPGTRGIVLLLLYLALDETDDRPLIIDQPEENLDPKSIYDELVGLFQAAKLKRQVIMVTHNANLVVNADADQIIIASVGSHMPGELPPITYISGGLEDAPIRQSVCDILEGGEVAFKERARRLRVALDR